MRSIFNKREIMALQDEFGDNNSPLTEAFPNLVDKFYVSGRDLLKTLLYLILTRKVKSS